MPFPTSRTSPILIEREANLAVLNELASRAAAGHCQMALLTGEAGIGKSRIAREIARRCQARGFDTLIGKCSERDLDFPFAPFVDALRQRIATNGADPAAFLGPEAHGLAELLPEHRELGLSQPDTPVAENSPEHGKRRLFENLASLLRRLAEARPLLLLLEDLHWSDPTSVQLLELLPRRLERSPLLILGTCRDDEASQDVIRSLITLQRERTSRIISLAPLTEPGTCAMLEAILSEPPPRHLVTSLHDRTGGNPFLIEELLALAPEAGPWPRSGILVPATVREVVARQVDGLDDDAMRIAELTAIIGERVDLDLLLAVSGMKRETFTTALRHLIERRVLVEARDSVDPMIAFRHALTRDAMLELLLGPERRALHLIVAETIEASGDTSRRGIAGDLGFHFHAAGEWARALPHATRAGEAAWEVRASTEALLHFRRALDAATALDDPSQAALRCRCGQALALLGAFDEAARELETALAEARAQGHAEVEQEALYALAGLYASHDYDTAHAWAKRALAFARERRDRPWEARTLNRLGNVLTNLMRFPESRRLHEAALGIIDSRTDRWSAADTLDHIGMSHYLSGDVPAARASFGEAAAIFLDIGDAERAASALSSRGLYLAVLDGACPSDAPPVTYRADAERGLRMSREMGWRAGEAYALVALATASLGNSQLAEARAHAEAALAIAADIDHPQWRTIALLTLGLLEANLLDAAGALRHLTEARELAQAIGSRQWTERLSAWIARCEWRLGQPVAPPPLPSTTPATIGQRRTLLTLIERELAEGRPDAAERLADQLLASGLAAEPMLLRAEALAALDRRDDADVAFLDARRIAGEAGPTVLLWRVAAGRSRLWRGVDTDLADAEARAAGNLVESIAGDLPRPSQSAFLSAAAAWVPDIPIEQHPATVAPGGLSPRELEVLRLLTAGRTDSEIADALFISRRTAATHVRHIYEKLGISSRAEAAAWAVRNAIA